MIMIPALLLLGLPAHHAIASSRVGVIGMGLASWLEFHRQRKIDYGIAAFITLALVSGSFVGVHMVLQLSNVLLKKLIAVLTLLSLLVLLLKPEAGVKKLNKKPTILSYCISFLLLFFIGIYAGFFGGISGSLVSLVFIFLFGHTFIQTIANRKPAFSLFAITNAAIFLLAGKVIYDVAFSLLAGAFIGSWIGAHYAEKIGDRRIKKMFLFMVFLMSLKLLLGGG